jgi:hypothetical protein
VPVSRSRRGWDGRLARQGASDRGAAARCGADGQADAQGCEPVPHALQARAGHRAGHDPARHLTADR